MGEKVEGGGNKNGTIEKVEGRAGEEDDARYIHFFCSIIYITNSVPHLDMYGHHHRIQRCQKKGLETRLTCLKPR
jgi:hypothetical protein